jgi:DNA polymerase-3 subunit epsilon
MLWPRVITAFAPSQIKAWPYAGTIGILEAGDVHIFDRCCYLGRAKNEGDVFAILENRKRTFDPDNFKLLKRWMPKLRSGDLINLIRNT